MKALAPDPGERYPDARALANDLDRWLSRGRFSRSTLSPASLLTGLAAGSLITVRGLEAGFRLPTGTIHPRQLSPRTRPRTWRRPGAVEKAEVQTDRPEAATVAPTAEPEAEQVAFI